MGVITTAKVITRSKRARRPVTIQLGNQEWVIVIKCISSYRLNIPLMVIFKGKEHLST